MVDQPLFVATAAFGCNVGSLLVCFFFKSATVRRLGALLDGLEGAAPLSASLLLVLVVPTEAKDRRRKSSYRQEVELREGN